MSVYERSAEATYHLPLPGSLIVGLAARYGGEVVGEAQQVGRFVALERAAAGDLAPFLRPRLREAARAALLRGAVLLCDRALAPLTESRAHPGATVWLHDHATWAMAMLLDDYAESSSPPVHQMGDDVVLGAHVELGDRVVVGSRVRIGASSVLGSPGFGWAIGPSGQRVHVPQRAGVVIEDDVWIGPLVTIDAGTLTPTVIRRGVKLDAHVHVGHNCDIGEGTVVAAQSGFAGSVKVGRGVLIGGQVGVADYVRIGDGARIAAKSGVTRDVPAGRTYGGYPAVPRMKWLRGMASMYARADSDE